MWVFQLEPNQAFLFVSHQQLAQCHEQPLVRRIGCWHLPWQPQSFKKLGWFFLTIFVFLMWVWSLLTCLFTLFPLIGFPVCWPGGSYPNQIRFWPVPSPKQDKTSPSQKQLRLPFDVLLNLGSRTQPHAAARNVSTSSFDEKEAFWQSFWWLFDTNTLWENIFIDSDHKKKTAKSSRRLPMSWWTILWDRDQGK